MLTTRRRDEFRAKRRRQRAKDHTVIIGFGVNGRSAAPIEDLLDPIEGLEVVERPIMTA